jgi:hypothetical protein
VPIGWLAPSCAAPIQIAAFPSISGPDAGEPAPNGGPGQWLFQS